LSVLYWVIYTEIIQAAFFVKKVLFLSMTDKENVQFCSQEIQRHGGGTESQRESDKGLGKGERNGGC